MNPTLPAAVFLVIAGLWLLLVGLRYGDPAWGRLTWNWPVPWPQMQPRSRAVLRAAVTLLGLLALGLAGWLAQRA